LFIEPSLKHECYSRECVSLRK